jgi:hypothetical protein
MMERQSMTITADDAFPYAMSAMGLDRHVVEASYRALQASMGQTLAAPKLTTVEAVNLLETALRLHRQLFCLRSAVS